MKSELQNRLEILGARLQQITVNDFSFFAYEVIKPTLDFMESIHQKQRYDAHIPQSEFIAQQITDLYDFSKFMKTNYKNLTQKDPDYELKNVFFQACEEMIGLYDNICDALSDRYDLFAETLLPEHLNCPLLLENLKCALQESLLHPARTPLCYQNYAACNVGKRDVGMRPDVQDQDSQPLFKKYKHSFQAVSLASAVPVLGKRLKPEPGILEATEKPTAKKRRF